MRAVTWMGKTHVEVRDVPDPRILNSRDAIVRITSTAICGSDLHIYNGLIPTMRKGDILGHEFMGEMVETGPAVTTLKVGDRVVVPFPIACGNCHACERGLTSLCENSNLNAGIAERLMGHSPSGLFGYSHMLGGYAGGQALFLSDILPTGYMGAEMCDITPGDVVAVWGAGPVGQFAIASALLLGAERVIAIDRFPYRLQMAKDRAGATDVINYEEAPVLETLDDLTAGRGPDACIDAVGMESHIDVGPAAGL